MPPEALLQPGCDGARRRRLSQADHRGRRSLDRLLKRAAGLTEAANTGCEERQCRVAGEEYAFVSRGGGKERGTSATEGRDHKVDDG